MAGPACVAVSLGTILFHCVLAAIARRRVAQIDRELPRQLFNEAIATAELCACCFELIVVADTWGVPAYAIVLFVLTIWWSFQWGDATACPYTHIEDLLEGKTDIRIAGLKIWAELTGGILVFRLVQIIWSLQLCEAHQNRAWEQCQADLQVPVIFGAIIEGIATALCRLSSRALSDLQPRAATIIDSFVSTALVVAAFNYSGGYFNPALATALKYGCEGHTATEHLIVYWVGACAGAVIAQIAYKLPVVRAKLLGEDFDRKKLY